jgi:signal transduction histidine kinase
MTWPRSLRGRFVLGALVSGIGLVLLAHLGSVLMVVGYLAFSGWLHVIGMFVTALLLLGAGWRIVSSGLSSLTRLRERLAAVHDGHDRQVAGEYPAEVQPLVTDLNELLAHRDRRVQDALARAGDLAHGLKTPLAVLAQEAERADAAGHADQAQVVQQQVERMRRHVDYHLAHARAAASGATPGARAAVQPSVDGLVRTLSRLHAGRGLHLDAAVDAGHAIRGHREDLDEMLGNLLDNACTWARTRVIVSSAQLNGHVTIDVDDDGPGLPEALRRAVLQRGVRADEAAPGSGFGLAIVREVAELYGGSIALEPSSLGGLRARLRLPAAGA